MCEYILHNFNYYWIIEKYSLCFRLFLFLLHRLLAYTKRYKKNLKAFYIVHPTFWTKMVTWWFTTFMAPAIKAKVFSLPGVEHLYSAISKDQLEIPAYITEYDMAVRNSPQLILFSLGLCVVAVYFNPFIFLPLARQMDSTTSSPWYKHRPHLKRICGHLLASIILSFRPTSKHLLILRSP